MIKIWLLYPTKGKVNSFSKNSRSYAKLEDLSRICLMVGSIDCVLAAASTPLLGLLGDVDEAKVT